MSENRFITHLEELARRQDRGALAALRRGLGRPPGTAVEMHPQVIPYLPDGWGWTHQCYYIVGALFGLHPHSAGQGDMGDVFRSIASKTDSESIEKRFVTLLKSHRDDLFGHLRHAVALAAGKDVAVCWDTLLRDLRHWDDDRRWVQRNWARSYWGGAEPSASEEQTAVSAKGD